MNSSASDNHLENDSGKIASSTAGQAAGDGRYADGTDAFNPKEPRKPAPKRPPLWRRVATRFSKLLIAAGRGPLM